MDGGSKQWARVAGTLTTMLTLLGLAGVAVGIALSLF